jgi:hypothetical protein
MINFSFAILLNHRYRAVVNAYLPESLPAARKRDARTYWCQALSQTVLVSPQPHSSQRCNDAQEGAPSRYIRSITGTIAQPVAEQTDVHDYYYLRPCNTSLPEHYSSPCSQVGLPVFWPRLPRCVRPE